MGADDDSGAAAAEGLVVFSPLPPTRSGIADYTAELLPALGRRVPVTAVSPPSATSAPWRART